MRVAVISDIHGNLHALETVLESVSAERPDEVWCLGDLVGYGPRPNECTTTGAGLAQLCLAGNHDLGVLGTIAISAFSFDAPHTGPWTRKVLLPEAGSFLDRLVPEASRPRVELYPANPID